MLKPALRPPMRAPMRSANSPREGVGVSRASQIVAHAQSGGWVGGVSAPWTWTIGGMTVTLETNNVRRTGIGVRKYLLPAGAANQSRTTRIQIPRASLTGGRIDIHYFMPSLSAGASYLSLYYSSDTPPANPPTAEPTNYRKITINPDVVTRSKWSVLTIHKSGKIYSNGTPAGTAWANTGSPSPDFIEFLAIEFGCDAATPDAERYLLYDCHAINGYRKPFLLFGVDGFGASGSKSTYLLPALQARNLNAYLAGDGNAAAAAASFLATWYAAGNDVVQQGMNHTNYASNPSLLSGDYDTARGILDGLGLIRAAKMFAYPLNSLNASTVATLDAKGVLIGRAGIHLNHTISELGNVDFTQMGSFGMGPTTTAAQLIALTDDAIQRGEGFSVLGHDFVASPSLSTESSIAETDTWLDYVKTKRDAGLLDVITPENLITRLAA